MGKTMSETRGIDGRIVFAVAMICIVLASGLIVVFANYVGIVNNEDSQIKTLIDQTTQLNGWLHGNESMLNILLNVTNSSTRQLEPAWKVEFYKGFPMSWPHTSWGVSTPEWELYCGGYSKVIIYMRLTSISPSLNGKTITIFLNYIAWYGSTNGGNDFVGMTTLSESMLNVTIPGPWDPQAGPLEVETKGPYFTFQFAVDSTYNASAWATMDMSVYFRN
jgi:hypothetical protein